MGTQVDPLHTCAVKGKVVIINPNGSVLFSFERPDAIHTQAHTHTHTCVQAETHSVRYPCGLPPGRPRLCSILPPMPTAHRAKNPKGTHTENTSNSGAGHGGSGHEAEVRRLRPECRSSTCHVFAKDGRERESEPIAATAIQAGEGHWTGKTHSLKTGPSVVAGWNLSRVLLACERRSLMALNEQVAVPAQAWMAHRARCGYRLDIRSICLVSIINGSSQQVGTDS